MKLNNPQLVADLPKEFLYFMEHLQTLRYADRPNYTYLHELLSDLYHKLGGDENTPFDWERERIAGPKRPKPVPNLVDICFLKVASNINRYTKIELEPSLQKRLVEFLLRVNDRVWDLQKMNMFLNDSLEEINLENCQISPEDFEYILTTCKNLKSLNAGCISEITLKNIVSNRHGVLEKLTFTDKISVTKPSKFLAEHCTSLTSLTIKNNDKVLDKTVETILKGCPNLRDLSLVECRKFKGTAFKSYYSSKKRVHNLKRLDISSCILSKRGLKCIAKLCEELEELVAAPIVTSIKISSNEFTELLQNCSNLKLLELASFQIPEMDNVLGEIARNCTQLTSLFVEGLSMTDFGLQHVVANCSQLKTLRFRYGDGVTDASLTQIARCCTLDSLTLDFWNKFNRLSVSDHGIKTLLQSCGNLKELSMCSCLILTGACFPETVYFPNLKLLNLSDCIQLNDFAIRRITESCPNLRSLYLCNLNNLSATALDSIAQGCPQLEELNLTQCTCFSDESMRDLLAQMPMLFMRVTRYSDPDLNGVTKEVHHSNVNAIFQEFPNYYRERAFDRTRRRMYGMGP